MMTEWDVLTSYKDRMRRLERMAEQNRLARLVRPSESGSRRMRSALIAAVRLLAERPSSTMHEEACVVAD